MKRILAVVVACWTVAAWGQTLTSEQYSQLMDSVKNSPCKSQPAAARAEVNQISIYLNGLDDVGVIRYLQEHKYRDLTLFDLAMHYCIKLPKPLGRLDTWRYESCQTDAAKAPTSQGVFAGMRVCREKFGQ